MWLARHLANCKRKSAYPSPERAAQCTLQGQSASFPPLVTIDEEGDTQDNEEKWLRAFAQPRPSTDTTDQVDKPGQCLCLHSWNFYFMLIFMSKSLIEEIFKFKLTIFPVKFHSQVRHLQTSTNLIYNISRIYKKSLQNIIILLFIIYF